MKTKEITINVFPRLINSQLFSASGQTLTLLPEAQTLGESCENRTLCQVPSSN